MIIETIEIPRALQVVSAEQQSVAQPTIVAPGNHADFDYCDVLASGFNRPANATNDRYTYDAPVIRGHASPNADILSRQAVYEYLGSR